MVEFEEDRKVEREAYAIINFFQCLSQANVAEQSQLPEATFTAIGGMATIERLIMDLKEESVDIFNNSVGALFQQLGEHMIYLNGITMSKSVLTEEANENFEVLKQLYTHSSSVNEEAYITLAKLRSIPDEKMLQILKFRPKRKKIGER